MQIDYKTQKTLTRLISLALLVQGLLTLTLTILDIFKYSNQVSSGHIVYDQFQNILKQFIVKSISALVQTTYALLLFFTRSHKLNILHYLIALIIFILPFLLNDQVLNQAESVIPQVKILVTKAYALDPPQQAQNDLNFQLQQYQNAHKDYLSAKNAYLNFNTLNSKTEAINKTKTLLIKRSLALKTHLFALRINLLNLPQDTKPQNLISQLELKEQFLSDHLKQIETIMTLNQVNSVSNILEDQYPQIQVLTYESLLQLISLQLDTNRQSLFTQHQALQDLLNQDSKQELNTNQITLWLDDAKQSLTVSPDDQQELDKLKNRLRPNNSSLIPNQRSFSKILNLLDKSRTNLLKSVGFLSETINLFKYGQI